VRIVLAGFVCGIVRTWVLMFERVFKMFSILFQIYLVKTYGLGYKSRCVENKKNYVKSHLLGSFLFFIKLTACAI
jgi:hypothetical protein